MCVMMELHSDLILLFATVGGIVAGIGNDCVVTDQNLTRYNIPTKIPSHVREVFLKDIDIENYAMDFDSKTWGNITRLDIQSTVGSFFRKQHKPIFKDIHNLEYIGIHSHKLHDIDFELFTDLPKVKTLDLLNCLMLNISDVANAFMLDTSLENVENVILSNINTAHRHSSTSLSKPFFELLKSRQIKTLNFNGMRFSDIDYNSMHLLCDSLEVLNESNIVYVPDGVSYIRNLSPCPSLRIVDISQTDGRYLTLRYFAYFFRKSTRKGHDENGFQF